MVIGYRQRWVVTDIVVTASIDGFRVVATTDVEVHMWMQVSQEPQDIQLRFRTLRGVKMRCQVTYGMSVANTIEQNEAGDTLVHTFDFEFFWVRQEIPLKFIAQVAAGPSGSNGPWFYLPAIIDGPYDSYSIASLDTYIWRRYPNDNYGAVKTFVLSGEPNTLNHTNILLHFPVPYLPPLSTVLKATLTLYWDGNSGNPYPAAVHRLLQPGWSEGFSTWNDYSFGEPWDTPGGDFESTYPVPVFGTSMWWTYPYRITWDLTTFIQPFMKNGWPLDLLIYPRDAWAWMRHNARTDLPPSKRPRLDITWATFDPDLPPPGV